MKRFMMSYIKYHRPGLLSTEIYGFSEQNFPNFSVNVYVKRIFHIHKKNTPRFLTFVRENVIMIS